MSMAPPAARRKSDAAAERRRQLEEWKKKKEAQRKRQSIGGRTSLGGGAASSRPSISGVSDYSRRGSSGTVGSVAQGTPTSRLHAAREGVQQWDKDRRVGAKLAVNDAAARRKKSISPPTATAARPPNPSSSSGKKKKTLGVVTRGTPSPPVAIRAAKENTPPSQGKALVPSPEAVSAFVASLRSVDVSNHHSPSLNNVVRSGAGPGLKMAATSWMNAPQYSSPPVMSTPRSGVSRAKTVAAARASLHRSASGGTQPVRQQQSREKQQTQTGPSPRSVALAEKNEAERREKLLAAQMATMNEERTQMQSNLALLGVKMGDLETEAETRRTELEREKAIAAAAHAALESARLEKLAAVEEKEFTIEAQAGMLQQLSAELERAEKCREDAERAKSSKDDKLARTQLELEKCAKELAQKQHQIHHMQSGGDIMGRDSLGSSVGRVSLGGGRRSSVYGGGQDVMEDLRQAESVARQSQERLIELVAAKQAAERDASDARAAAAKWESEVTARRGEVEMMQEELEACLEVERTERRKAEELYEMAKEEKAGLERIVSTRAEEISTLEERLVEATAAADEIRAGIEERDQLLRDGDAMLEQKEAELDQAAEYALSLQNNLDELRAEQERMRAEKDAGSPPRPSEEENARNKEALILHLKSENEAQVKAAEREIETLKFQLEERDVAVSDAEGKLAAREAECAKLQSEVFAKSNALSPLKQRADAAQNVLNAMEKELDSRDAQLRTVTDQLMAAMSAEKRQTRAVARLEMSLAEREETVRNMNEQLREVSTKAGMASAVKKERDQYHQMFENAENARRTLEQSLASNRDENVHRLHLAQQERAAALSRAEALQATVSSKEAQAQSLVEKASAAERAAEFERTKLAGLAAAADEAVENANAQVIETRAELEGQMLQMRTELGHQVEEAEARVGEVQSAAEARVAFVESQLKASLEEVARLTGELESARRSQVSSDVDRQLRLRLEGEVHVAKTNVASANVRVEEARAALKAAEDRSLELEQRLVDAERQLRVERRDKEERLEVAAKLQAEREDAAAHATRELEGRLHAAESAAEAGAAEVDRLNAAVVSLRSEVTDAGGLSAEAAAKIAHLEDELAAADTLITTAKAEAADYKSKADDTEKESLFFLGEMQVAVADAEKKIVALHKTVASRDLKLSQLTAEVKALKEVLRDREEKLGNVDARTAAMKKAHHEELESMKGEGDGHSIMLEMETNQLRENLEDKRSKIKRLQEDLGVASDKNKTLLDQCERARAAQSIAEETAADALKVRDEFAAAMKSQHETNSRANAAADEAYKLHVEELEDELKYERTRAAALAREAWKRGMRPDDLSGDAATALEDLVGEEMSAASPQTRIQWMTESATKIDFAKFKSSVEKIAAGKRGPGLAAAGTPVGAERPMLLSQLVSSVKKAAPIPATVTPTAQPRFLAMANKENGSVNGFTPSPAAARLKRSKNGNENDAENVVAALGKMEMTVGDDRRITRGLSRREALTEMRNGN